MPYQAIWKITKYVTGLFAGFAFCVWLFWFMTR
jgi:hypothetical protein